jgi:hypothetical protein
MVYNTSKIKKIDPLEPGCKKTMYNSLEDAQEMIRYLNENRRVPEIRAYKCLICGFWHLTSKSK